MSAMHTEMALWDGGREPWVTGGECVIHSRRYVLAEGSECKKQALMGIIRSISANFADGEARYSLSRDLFDEDGSSSAL